MWVSCYINETWNSSIRPYGGTLEWPGIGEYIQSIQIPHKMKGLWIGNKLRMRQKSSIHILISIFFFWFSCSIETEKRENYNISLIDFEDISIIPDSLFTHILFEFNVFYDFIEGVVDAGPYTVSDVEVVWTSNIFYTDMDTGAYSKCETDSNNYFDCPDVDGSMFVIDTYRSQEPMIFIRIN